MSETRFCLECDRKTESGESYGRAYCRECGSFYDDSEMNDREKKISEIRETLEKATPGSWKWVDVYKKIDFEKYNMGGFVNEEGKLICHFGNRIDYYPTEGEPPDYYDELLIANAPEWLRFLLDELERLEREYAEERAAHNAHVTELCELEEDNRKLRENIERIIEILKNGQQAHWQTFKIRQLLEVPLE